MRKKLALIFAGVLGLLFVLPSSTLAYHFSYPPFVRFSPKPTLKLDVSFHEQEHVLSCEVATLRMALLNRGIDIAEDDLIANMPFGPMGSDPDLVFVGNINGRQFSTGYGIHWDGLSTLANRYAPAGSFYGADLHFLIDRLHDGNPVVIWGSQLRVPPNASWVTPEGKYVHAVRGEHTWVVNGYAGPRRAPTHIFTLDPLRGERVFRTGDFLDNWENYHNSGMFLK